MRNEAANVAGSLGSLLRQDYSGFTVVVVDDGSSDGTGAALAALAVGETRLRVVVGTPLPPGWTGKNWALQQGVSAADPRAEWLLTLDADMRLDPAALASALAYALQQGADLLTLLPLLELGSFWEKLLVPHAGELYSLLVGTMAQVNDPGGRAAAANGQFMLVRRAAYDEHPIYRAVRGEVAEDWALAGRVKAAGYRLLMAQGREILRARVYAGFGELWSGFSKTLFPASGRSLGRVALVAAALTWYGSLPPLRLGLAAFALARARNGAARRRLEHSLAQVVPMLALRGVLDHSLGISPLYGFAYPLAVLLGDGMMLWSAWRYLSGRGMGWKGRNYF